MDGSTPLFLTVWWDNSVIAELLISNVAAINARNNAGITLLHCAALSGRAAIIDILLGHKASVYANNKDNFELLSAALECGHFGLIDRLLDEDIDTKAGTDKGALIFHSAVQLGHKRLADIMIENGIDSRFRNRKGGTLLHSAALGNIPELIDFAIEHGANVNERNEFGLTALHKAAAAGNLAAVEKLLEAGADPNIKSANGGAPYHYASDNKHTDIADLLSTKGADTSKRLYPVIMGAYIGQKSPGKTPEIFAPEIVSYDNSQEFAGTFAPDGTEFFFTRRKYFSSGSMPNPQRIWHMKLEKTGWTIPKLAPFTYDIFEFEPHISPDGNKLFFGSERPKPGTSEPNRRADIWVVEKTGDGWGEPYYLDPVVNNEMPMYVTATLEGTIYYTGNLSRGIYRSRFVDGEYTEPERLPDEINHLYSGHPYIAPDESYIIFDARPRTNIMKNDDLYVSFRNKGGSWTEAVRIDEPVSSSSVEICASVSSDGKYLFFKSNRAGSMNIYWIDAKILNQFKEK
jgi:ankyrin repeat protein